jgi:hypothetical protein
VQTIKKIFQLFLKTKKELAEKQAENKEPKFGFFVEAEGF